MPGPGYFASCRNLILAGKAMGPKVSFVLTQALMGAVRSALLSEPARLKQPGFEDALVRLVAGFLGVTQLARP